MSSRAGRRSFLLTVTGGLLLGAAGALHGQSRRAFGCSDRDSGERADPAWAHGADKDLGANADPVLRHLNHDATDRGPTADAGSHPRGRRPLLCPPKPQVPAR